MHRNWGCPTSCKSFWDLITRHIMMQSLQIQQFCNGYVDNQRTLNSVFGQSCTAHAQELLFMRLRGKFWLRHYIHRPRFPKTELQLLSFVWNPSVSFDIRQIVFTRQRRGIRPWLLVSVRRKSWQRRRSPEGRRRKNQAARRWCCARSADDARPLSGEPFQTQGSYGTPLCRAVTCHHHHHHHHHHTHFYHAIMS